MCMDREDLYQRIVSDYKETGSVKETSANCETSAITVRRVLITEGLWSSKTSLQIAELRDQGKSIAEIAEELCVTEKNVQSYLPYSRGKYGVAQTDNSVRSKEYRERMATAARNMHQNMASNEDYFDSIEGDIFDDEDGWVEVDSSSPQEERTHKDWEKALEEHRQKRRKEEISKFTCEEYKRLTIPCTEPLVPGEDEPFYSDFYSNGTVYRLELEIVGSDLDTEQFSGKKRKELLKLAKAEKSISREILVPGDMNLHALHYAIQRLFGWQNGHLHNFSLSQEDFDRVTAGRFGPYAELCGVLFRYPVADDFDLSWDDDYLPNQSVRSWLKTKYVRPFQQLAFCDIWLINQGQMAAFKRKHPQFKHDSYLFDVDEEASFTERLDLLMESLEVRQLFAMYRDADDGVICEGKPRPDTGMWKTTITEQMKGLEAQWEAAPQADLFDAISDLKRERQEQASLRAYEWEVQERINAVGHPVWGSREMIYRQFANDVRGAEERCMDLFTKYRIDPMPMFNSIYYDYDYGDRWTVRISVKDIYWLDEYAEEDGHYGNLFEEDIPDPLRSKLYKVDALGQPMCVAADGLNVVEDCGGIYGFYGMLKTMSKNDEESAETRQWAKELGWTGRKNSPANML